MLRQIRGHPLKHLQGPAGTTVRPTQVCLIGGRRCCSYTGLLLRSEWSEFRCRLSVSFADHGLDFYVLARKSVGPRTRCSVQAVDIGAEFTDIEHVPQRASFWAQVFIVSRTSKASASFVRVHPWRRRDASNVPGVLAGTSIVWSGSEGALLSGGCIVGWILPGNATPTLRGLGYVPVHHARSTPWSEFRAKDGG